MYTLQLDIGSITSPTHEGGYIEVVAVFDGVNISKKEYEDEFFKRNSVSGSIKLTSTTFTALKTLSNTYSKVNAKIYHGTTLQVTTELNIRQTLDNDGFISVNTLKILDKYTVLLDKYDESQDFLSIEDTYSVKVVKDIEFETRACTVTNHFITGIGNCSQSTYSALKNVIDGGDDLLDAGSSACLPDTSEYRIIKMNFIETDCYYQLPTGYVHLFTIQTVWSRQVYWAAKIGGEYTGTSGWTATTETKTVNGILYKKYVKSPYSGLTDYILSYVSNHIANYTLSGIDTAEDDIIYTRFRDVKDVIELFTTNLDSSITVNSTSFPYFTGNFENLFIATLSDILLSDAFEQKSDPATKSELSLKSLFDWFKVFKIYWYIDSSNKLIIDHIDNIDSIGTTFDATDYNNKNWTEHGNKISFNDKDLFYKQIFECVSGNLDFLQQTVEFSKLSNIVSDNNKTTNLLTFHTDILHIQTDPSKYNDSISEFVLLVAEDKENVDYLTTAWNNSTPGFSSFSYSDTPYKALVLIANNGNGEGKCNSNSFAASENDTINFQFIRSDTVTDHIYIRLVRLSDHSTIMEQITIGGINSGTFTIPDTDSYYISFYKTGADGASLDIIQIVNILIYNEDELIVISDTGEVSGTDIANSPLSLANLLENQYLYRLPDNTVSYNSQTDVALPDAVKFPAEIQEIILGIRDINELDVDGIITDYGTGELMEASMPINGGLTKVKIKQT